MQRPLSIVLLSLSLVVAVVGCGDGQSAGDDADAGAGGADGAVEGGVDAGPPQPLSGISLPQAVGDSMWANPDVYAEIPVRVATDGDATSVTVAIGGDEIAATDADGDGEWMAMVSLAGRPDGAHTLTASAAGEGAAVATATAELHVGRTGVQLTSIGVDGLAGTPRVHRIGDELWVTWTDWSATRREAWMRRIDGAGRWQGERVALIGSDADTLYARAAVGTDSVGVLYQQQGGPYSNYFEVVGLDGGKRTERIALEPDGWYGSYGGDVVFDGESYVVVWRINQGGDASAIRWMRVVEETGAIVGPKDVAVSGHDDPHGGFDPHSFITAAAIGDRVLVGFARDYWDAALEMAIPSCQVAAVTAEGVVSWTERAEAGGGFWWDWECRVFGLAARVAVMWSATDLLDSADEPPTALRATVLGDSGVLDPARGNGALVVTAPLHRSEFELVAHPTQHAVMAWLDERSYVDLTGGAIELYVAPVSAQLSAGEPVVFEHARFIAGTSQLDGALAGTNVVLVWIDERHGNGILDSKPELWFETAWF